MNKIQGMVCRVDRINNSVYGNPNWEFFILDTDGNYHRVRTSANISQSFTVNNDGGMVDKTYEFELTRSDRVTGWVRLW